MVDWFIVHYDTLGDQTIYTLLGLFAFLFYSLSSDPSVPTLVINCWTVNCLVSDVIINCPRATHTARIMALIILQRQMETGIMSPNLYIVLEWLNTAWWKFISYTALFNNVVHFHTHFRTLVFQLGASLVKLVTMIYSHITCIQTTRHGLYGMVKHQSSAACWG